MAWIAAKTDWDAADYFNYGDVNRVENNTDYIADYVETNLGNRPAIVGTKVDWANTDIVYAANMQRIESNVTLIKTRLGTPTGWGTPVTWVTLLKFDYTDANRLETNLSLLKTMAENVNAALLYCGDVIAGEGGTAL
jgi:hypothetical protein